MWTKYVVPRELFLYLEKHVSTLSDIGVCLHYDGRMNVYSLWIFEEEKKDG